MGTSRGVGFDLHGFISNGIDWEYKVFYALSIKISANDRAYIDSKTGYSEPRADGKSGIPVHEISSCSFEAQDARDSARWCYEGNASSHYFFRLFGGKQISLLVLVL